MECIGFIGAGRLATGLAVTLQKRGYSIAALHDKATEPASRLRNRLQIQNENRSPQEVVRLSKVVFITTPDSNIEEVVNSCIFEESKFIFHCSGALSTDVLAKARQEGAETGAFHPLQVFSSPESAINLLPGTTFGIEGSEKSVSLLERFAREIGGNSFLIPSEKKPLYHAAAVFLSNYQVTLAQIASEIFAEVGMEQDQIQSAIKSLLVSTTETISREGVTPSLTGPIERGDIGVIRGHLEAMGDYDEEVEQLYRKIGKKTIPIALDKGAIDAHKAKIIFELLEQRQR